MKVVVEKKDIEECDRVLRSHFKLKVAPELIKDIIYSSTGLQSVLIHESVSDTYGRDFLIEAVCHYTMGNKYMSPPANMDSEETSQEFSRRFAESIKDLDIEVLDAN